MMKKNEIKQEQLENVNGGDSDITRIPLLDDSYIRPGMDAEPIKIIGSTPDNKEEIEARRPSFTL